MITDKQQKFTRLTLEKPDMKIVFERPFTDVNETELLEGFFTLIIGMGFTPDSVYRSMDSFLSNYAPGHELNEINPSPDR